MNDQSLTPAEAAAFLGISVFTVKRWAREGRVPGAWQTPGGWWKFSRTGLEELTVPSAPSRVPMEAQAAGGEPAVGTSS